MKRKILFINPSLRQGGVEHALITTLRTLDPAKYDVTLFLYTDMADLLPQVPAHVKVITGTDRTKYFRTPYPAAMMLLYRVFTVLGQKDRAEEARRRAYRHIHQKKITRPRRKYFSGERFDVIVSYSLHMGTEMALRIPAGRYVVAMHSSDPDYHREIIEQDLPRYDVIVGVSRSIADLYKTHYPALADKIICIDNYIDGERVLAKAKEPTGGFRKPEGTFVIATCGRISHEKGFDLAVAAAERLRQQGKAFLWLFIGDGAQRQELEQAIRDKRLEDHIQITGFQENPYPWLACCDCYVQPSYEEAQPLVLLEAMLLGRPIISTKTVGGTHILEGGKKGVLTDFTGEALAGAIADWMDHPENMRAFANAASLEENAEQKKRYAQAWDRLLSE